MSAVFDLKAQMLHAHPLLAARSLEDLPEDAAAEELRGIDADTLSEVLENLATGRALNLFAQLAPEQQVGVLSLASPRLTLLLLGEGERSVSAAVLDALPAPVRQDLDRLLSFEKNTAGRLMDRPLDAMHVEMTVSEALREIRRSGFKRLRSFYVVDNDGRLNGKVDMQALALARRDQQLRELMVPPDGVVPMTATREDIVSQLDRFQVDSLPVVDAAGKLVGVVRYQRLFEAIENVATADLQKMVGVSADERALSPAGYSVRRRLPWLHINLLTAFLAAAVVGVFESLIAQFSALAVLLPVVAGQSGNAGSQALAVTIRGLALREIGTREWRRVLTKEILVGAVNGVVLAATCGLGVFLWSGSIGLTLVIAVAMLLSMIAAGISGALVPVVLTRIGQDPATASSIILTTVTDVSGFISFLGTASLLSFML